MQCIHCTYQFGTITDALADRVFPADNVLCAVLLTVYYRHDKHFGFFLLLALLLREESSLLALQVRYLAFYFDMTS
jgi:hypothetical protein